MASNLRVRGSIQRPTQGVESRGRSSPLANDGRGQDGRSLWRRQSGTGGRPVKSVRPRSPSCPRLSSIAALRRLGMSANCVGISIATHLRATEALRCLRATESKETSARRDPRDLSRSTPSRGAPRWVVHGQYTSAMCPEHAPSFAMGEICVVAYRSGRSSCFACRTRRLPFLFARTPPKIPPDQNRCGI